MISTAEKVLSAWGQFKKQRDGSYRGNCPYRPGSDSGGFVLRIDDGEHGAYTDHASGDSGSLYDLASKLNIDVPKDGRVEVASSKRAYENLADYAKRHYVEPEVFAAAGWQDDTWSGKPAISYRVQTGKRFRLLSEEDSKSPYRWGDGERGNCWYGLDRAINLAHKKALPIVICNGEASTVVADHYGIPAFCGTGGEGAVSDDMLAELKRRWNGQVYIAQDCDRAGQEATEKLQSLLPNAIPIDLGLSDKGDLADFCGLHREQAMSALKRIAGAQVEQAKEEAASFIEFLDGNELLVTFNQFLWEQPELFGRVVKMPYASLRSAGGFAELMTTKKVWFIGNVSGGGKTILSESLCDAWNELGYNTFYIGDEWTPMELTGRRLMRASNGHDAISYMDYLRYAKGERELTEAELTSIAYAMRRVRGRSGRPYYMQVSDTHKGVAFLEDIMSAAAAKIKSLKANGVMIDVIVLDYLSLYDTRATATGNNVEEYKAGVFKSWCKSLDVLGVSTVQVKKESEERVKTRGGFLNQHDLYWLRPDKGNLITTMNRVYKTNMEANNTLAVDDHDAYKPYQDENGNPEPTPNFCMVTAKNSVSNPFEFAYFHFDFDRMAICEGLAPGYYYDEFHRVVLPTSHPSNTNGRSSWQPIPLEDISDV